MSQSRVKGFVQTYAYTHSRHIWLYALAILISLVISVPIAESSYGNILVGSIVGAFIGTLPLLYSNHLIIKLERNRNTSFEQLIEDDNVTDISFNGVEMNHKAKLSAKHVSLVASTHMLTFIPFIFMLYVVLHITLN